MKVRDVQRTINKLTKQELRDFTFNVAVSIFGGHDGRGWYFDPDKEVSYQMSGDVADDLEAIGIEPGMSL